MAVVDAPSMWEAAAQLFEPPSPRQLSWATPGEMAKALDPRTVQTAALDLIDSALVNVAEGRCKRLIITMPPQEGKSQRVSRRFPLWLLTRNPNLRIVIASYEHGVARRWGRDIRNDIATHSAELGLTVQADTSAAHEWKLAGHDGGVYCVGIGGALTGRPADCLRGDSRVMTEWGYVPIRELCDGVGRKPRVLSYNQAIGRVEWRPIVATRTVPDRPLVEVVTDSGHRVVCTPDHRIYTTDRGWVHAADLQPGQGLIAASSGGGRVPGLQSGIHQGSFELVAREAGDSPVLLQGVPVWSGRRQPCLRWLRCDVHPPAVRGRQGDAQWSHPLVLHENLLHRQHVGLRDRASAGTASECRASADHPQRQGTHRGGAAPISHPRVVSAVGWHEPKAAMHGLRDGAQVAKSAMQALLSVGSGIDVSDRGMRDVRHAVREDARRVGEQEASRARAVLLQGGVPSRQNAGESDRPVLAMQWADEVDGGPSPLLLVDLPYCSSDHPAPGERATVPAMRGVVYSQVDANGVLRPDMRGRGALRADDWRGQLAPQGWDKLRGVVPADAPIDPGARRREVRGVPGAGSPYPDRPDDTALAAVAACGASLERDSSRQPSREFDNAVPPVSHAPPQVGVDTVSMVRELHGERDTVYDIQVDGNSNFFAEGVLVHNCMIMDDPLKGRKEADSETFRSAAWDWWTETARTRLGPDAPVVVIMTRWHEEDIAGRLLRDDEASWTVINIPAQANHRPEEGETDPLGREPGEYLQSTRGRHISRPAGSCAKHPGEECCDWDDIKRDVGSRAWNALYQGEPSPPEGSIFKRSWWQSYDQPQWVEQDDGTCHGLGFDELVISWDMTFKGTDGTDFVCGQVWGRRQAKAYLLDQKLARMSFVDTCQAVRELSAKWPKASAKLVEDKANGPAVINALQRTVSGLIAVQPEGSKEARAAAVSPFVEAGDVFLPAPELAPWVGGLIDECSNFPVGRHDDQVDALSQALNRLLLRPVKPRVRWV